MKYLVLFLLLVTTSAFADTTFVAKGKEIVVDINHTTIASTVSFNSVTLPIFTKDIVEVWIEEIKQVGLSAWTQRNYYLVWRRYKLIRYGQSYRKISRVQASR